MKHEAMYEKTQFANVIAQHITQQTHNGEQKERKCLGPDESFSLNVKKLNSWRQWRNQRELVMLDFEQCHIYKKPREKFL